ncbi:Purine catabolism regulatory protein [Paraliobacillus sp. PM-2]|uniref:PucR family transcriptional regulator n=1 Tax=Paraliobacillus sp. PM-2 TaxID=1462524 RepID=UPI00061BA6BE|nr:PucR family transcriptional regulator [Paraliobacillus sp. PM-2]CQR47304.1 Purine catabolism regulatory protein [Paraliobacillus sp. PM-2]
MSVSIDSVLHMKAFSDVKMIAGHKGINRKIQNVYVMEVPDIFPYIDREGLLFTTLYPIVNDEEAMRSFIPKLAEKGLAGVAIKLGRYIKKVPEYMIEQANHYHLPIIILPEKANLSTLTNHILTTLLGMKTNMLEFRENISHQLHTLLLQGANMEKFVEYVSKITGGSIVILDNSLNCVASSIPFNYDSLAINKENFYRVIDAPHSNNETQDILKIDEKVYQTNQLYIQSIAAGRKKLGYLVVLFDQNKETTEHIEIIIEQAIILLAFLLQTEQTIIEKERNYLDSFVRDIMNGRYQSQAEIIEKAKVFRWSFNFPNVIMLIKSNIDDSSKRLSSYYKILDSERIPRIISSIFDVPIQNCKVIYYNDELLCFISVAFETRLTERLKRAGNEIIASLKDYGEMGVSISDPIYQMNQVKVAYDHALLVHHIYYSTQRSGSFVEFYRDLGLYKLFHLVNDQNSLKDYMNDKIGIVIDYDQQRDMDLLGTLFYLVKHKGNLQKTADDMYIHYNSLRYRVNKLKELGLTLDDGHAFTEIAVACKLYQYLNV